MKRGLTGSGVRSSADLTSRHRRVHSGIATSMRGGSVTGDGIPSVVTRSMRPGGSRGGASPGIPSSHVKGKEGESGESDVTDTKDDKDFCIE